MCVWHRHLLSELLAGKCNCLGSPFREQNATTWLHAKHYLTDCRRVLCTAQDALMSLFANTAVADPADNTENVGHA